MFDKIKKNLGYIIMILVLICITALIFYTIISKRNIKKEKDTFNIKVGDVLKFDDYDTVLTIDKVTGILCTNQDKCKYDGVEVFVTAKYNDEQSTYTLNSKDEAKVRINNSNNYIVITYEDEKITLEVKDRFEI